MSKTIFMGTTKIAPETTAHEIHSLLVGAGARQVLTEYNEQREITGIHFIMSVGNKQIPFKMPVRTEKLLEYFKGKGKTRRHSSYRHTSKEDLASKAKRVAWRQLFRWVEAQLAFIDAGMAQTEEVFMAYIQVAPNETFYQRAIKQGFDRLALPEKTE
jgi:hypothetical protein